MTAPRLDVLLALLGGVAVLVAIVAPLGWRWVWRVAAFGLAGVAVELLLIASVPAVGAWLGVSR